jgi:hypothetical protein
MVQGNMSSSRVMPGAALQTISITSRFVSSSSPTESPWEHKSGACVWADRKTDSKEERKESPMTKAGRNLHYNLEMSKYWMQLL